jgi:hypothetical protein
MTATSRKPLTFHSRTLDVPLSALRLRSLNRPVHGSADQKLVERVRREFSDMRGLSPTMAQARRLFHVAHEECHRIFAQLLQEGFLDLGPDERYRLKSP